MGRSACALLLAIPANADPRDPSAAVFKESFVTDSLAILAAGWGVLMAISPLLQVRRMLGRRSSGDISIGYLSVLQVGFGLWLAYGIALGNAAIIVPNCVAFVVNAATIGIAIRFRDAAPRSPLADRLSG